MVLNALNKDRPCSYTICMKINQLPLTILFGLLFAVAGGNAFAGEALDQLKDWANTTAPAGEVKLAPPPDSNLTNKANLALDTKQLANPVGTVKAAEPPAPAPNPIKEFISENKTTIFGRAGRLPGLRALRADRNTAGRDLLVHQDGGRLGRLKAIAGPLPGDFPTGDTALRFPLPETALP